MKLLGSPSVAPPSPPPPTPWAGSPPVVATASPRAVRGDAILRPAAAPIADPNGVCPDPSRDRYPQAIGVGLAAAALLPFIPAIAEGASLEALAATVGSRLATSVTTAGTFAQAAAKAYVDEAAPFARGFATRDDAAKTIGMQAWRATEESVRAGLVGAGLAGGHELARQAIDTIAQIAHGRSAHHDR